MIEEGDRAPALQLQTSDGDTIDVGNVTSFRLTNLPAEAAVAVSAYYIHRDGMDDQTDGHESWHTPVPRAPLEATMRQMNRVMDEMEKLLAARAQTSN